MAKPKPTRSEEVSKALDRMHAEGERIASLPPPMRRLLAATVALSSLGDLDVDQRRAVRLLRATVPVLLKQADADVEGVRRAERALRGAREGSLSPELRDLANQVDHVLALRTHDGRRINVTNAAAVLHRWLDRRYAAAPREAIRVALKGRRDGGEVSGAVHHIANAAGVRVDLNTVSKAVRRRAVKQRGHS